MKLILIGCFSLFLVSCATSTPYQPFSRDGGYTDNFIQKDLMVARFSANANTNRKQATLFSAFRAVELCQKLNYKFARLYTMTDQTVSQTVQKSATYGYQQPTTTSGTANTNYSNLGGFGQANTNFNATTSGGSTTASTTTWNETYQYPIVDTYFTCKNETFDPMIDVKVLSEAEAKDVVKDRLPALQVVRMEPDSLNQGNLQVGDYIVRINERRIQGYVDYTAAIDSALNKDKVSADIIREGKPFKTTIKAIDISNAFLKANTSILKAACRNPDIQPRPACQPSRSLSSEK